MQRRQFLLNTAFTAGGVLLSQKQLLAGIWQQPPFKISMLTKDVGIFTEKGGTIAFMLSKKGIVVVDAEFPEQSQHLITELRKQHEEPFRLLINTHHHLDHTAGNISFKGLTEHVLAHTNSKINQENVAKLQKTEDKQLYPDQTYSDTWCDKVAGEKICLYYFGPGHTNGDSLVHFTEDDIVHMGDLVFNRRHPFIDRSAGASIANWIVVLNKTVNKFGKKTTFVFGHAGDGYNVTGSAADLSSFQEYLSNLLHFVSGEIKNGKTKEDILKAVEIPGSPEWKGDGIQRPLTAAYEELTAN